MKLTKEAIEAWLSGDGAGMDRGERIVRIEVRVVRANRRRRKA